MTNRRDALRTLAAGAVAAGAQAQTSHANHEPEKEQPQVITPAAAKFFSEPEMKLLARLTDLIIPRTDTPGAADVGVPALIDLAAGSKAVRGDVLREGMKKLPADFLTSPEPRQVAVLQRLEQQKSPFFRALKTATIDFYYTTPLGLEKELGWHGNRPLPSFPGCTHPEHQV